MSEAQAEVSYNYRGKCLRILGKIYRVTRHAAPLGCGLWYCRMADGTEVAFLPRQIEVWIERGECEVIG